MIKTVLESLMAKQRFHWERPKTTLSSPKQAQWHNTPALHVQVKGTSKNLTYTLGSHSIITAQK